MELLNNTVREDDRSYGRFILNYFQNVGFFGIIGKGLAYEY